MGLKDRLFGSPQDRFARRVLQEITAAGVAEARYEAEEFAIYYRRRGEEDKNPAIAYLRNIFRECGDADADADADWQRERIARYVRAVVLRPDLPETWKSVMPLSRPVLRVTGFAGAAPGGVIPLSRPAFPYVDELVVVDQPDSMAYVTNVAMGKWGVGPEAVFHAARENQSRAAPTDHERSETPVLLRMIDDGNAYWSSCLLVDGWLAGLAGAVGGRPVAFVPDTGGMLITADQPDVMASLFEMVEKEYQEAPRSMFPTAYTVDDAGKVVPYKPPPGHPLETAVHRSEVLLASEAYGRQAEALQSATDEDGVFVAGLLVAERDGGSLITVASWAEDVDTLLPVADYVGFSSEHGAFFVPWAAVADELSPWAVEGMRPTRYRVRNWPEPSIMDRLRSLAVTP